DPELRSVIHPAFDEARRATAADGPFRGVPVLMKDIGGAEAGRPYCAGMRFLKDAGWREPVDAYLTQSLNAAGFVSIGRTSTPELALLPTTEPEAFGPTRNPWNTAHSPGGSSGGAAAAVAAGLVPVAHANDGGGSIRMPSSACGLVGLKPSRGRVPQLVMAWEHATVEGAITRYTRDAAALLDAMSVPDRLAMYQAPPPERPFAHEVGRDGGRLRIGLLTTAP